MSKDCRCVLVNSATITLVTKNALGTVKFGKRFLACLVVRWSVHGTGTQMWQVSHCHESETEIGIVNDFAECLDEGLRSALSCHQD